MNNDNPAERKNSGTPEPQASNPVWPFGMPPANMMAAFNPMTYAAMFTPTQQPVADGDLPKPTPDLLTYWRQAYNMNEEQATRYFQQLVSSDIFTAAMSKYMEALTPTQEAIQHNLEKFLQANGLPTRNDITHLAEQIVTLDAKLDTVQDEIEDMMDDNHASLSATVATVQTALENVAMRLDRLLALEERVEDLSRRVERVEQNRSRKTQPAKEPEQVQKPAD